jgi:hypothetical protein
MNRTELMSRVELDLLDQIDQLEVRLQAKLSGRIRDLQLSLRGCGVVLRGLARTYHAKQLAQHALMSETSLPIHANEIDVA